jgi:hypothetical protein
MSERDRIRLEVEERAQKQEHDSQQDNAEHSPPAEHHILQMQRTQGNQAVQRLVSSVQRVPFEEGGELDDELSGQINSARGTGSTLDTSTAESMGQQMDYDFSGVNVHTGSDADRLSRSIGAKAFTTGSDIFFKSGEYNPGSSAGQNLLAHELTHVVQQGGQAPSGGNLTVGPASDSYESEADSMAASLTMGGGDMQRETMDDEDMLQAKRDDVQRESVPEEEDEILLKRDDIQRESIEDEEMLQG